MSFDRETAKILSAEAKDALEEVASKYGLMLTQGPYRWSGDRLTMKWEFVTVATDGAPADFAATATRLGIPPDCWGAPFRCGNGTIYTVSGIKTSRPKYPLVGIGPRGGRYKFTVDQVRNGLKAQGGKMPKTKFNS